MSESEGGPGQREVAYRLFAAEFEDADLDYSESDEERAPNYVVTPTGARVNRLFVVGVLTEVEPVSDDVLRGRVVDPTGAFVLYAGQYQQDERAFLERVEPPTFVAVTGKARTFQPEDSDRVFTSVRPESISEVDGDTRDRWTVDAAAQTLERVDSMATGIALGVEDGPLRQALEDRGVEAGLADGIALALDHYGTTPTYLAAVRDLAVDAAQVIAGEIEEVSGLTASPDDAGDVTASDLSTEPVEPLDVEAEPESTAAPSTNEGRTGDVEEPNATETDGEAVAEPATEADAEPEPEMEAEPGSESESETTAGSVETAPAESTTEAESSEPAPGTPDASETEEGPGDFEPGEFDLDESEREEIEAEYGTEFQSGTEVDEPGEADIESPDPEEIESDSAEESEATQAPDPDRAEQDDGPAAEEAGEGTDVADETGEGTDVADETGEGTEAADETGAVDLEDAVVAAMEELDDGDGAGHEAVVEAVTDRTGADAAAVDDAIQDALMDGRCYEPEDDVFKPI